MLTMEDRSITIVLPKNGRIEPKKMINLLKWFQRNVDEHINRIHLDYSSDTKTIFKVTCDITDGPEEFLQKDDFNIQIDAGVTATEMCHGIVTLLSTVMAHENSNDKDKWSLKSFMHFIESLMTDAQFVVLGNNGDKKND